MQKCKWDYDDDYDDLAIFKKGQKSYGSIDFDNLILDFTSKGEFVGIELMDATQYLSNLTGEKITKERLMNIADCDITAVKSGEQLIVRVILLLKDKTTIKTAVTAPLLQEKAVKYA
jgi:uncharacterized protein YuzE